MPPRIFSEWGGWPSGMHKFIKGKARMKDVGVLLLVPMQRILNDKARFLSGRYGLELGPCGFGHPDLSGGGNYVGE